LLAQTPAGGLWAELANKRTALPSLRQEFEVPQTSFKTANGSQGSKRQIVLDMAGERWREKSLTGSGNCLRSTCHQASKKVSEG